MKKEREYLVLFKLGCADLKLAGKNLDDKEIRPQLLLFHLQQAVEKFLKSLLSFRDIRYPKTHDIEKLIDLTEKSRIKLSKDVEEFINLTPYAVEIRYGFIIEEVLDIHYYYQKIKDFKEFIEKFYKVQAQTELKKLNY